MSFKFIETYYGKKFYRGQKVSVMICDQWFDGVITSATHCICVKCESISKTKRFKFHPTDDSHLTSSPP
jgi:hypothetical protein